MENNDEGSVKPTNLPEPLSIGGCPTEFCPSITSDVDPIRLGGRLGTYCD